MSTITSLKLGVVPITEEGVDRYKFSDNIELHFTSVYETFEGLNCSVGRIFTKMKVPVSWFTVMNANYLIADMDINNPAGSSLHIKGWIDSIDMISDSEEYPQVEIRWHFDYYEMYKSLITLGYGHIKRRPFNSISDTPVQNYSYRYLEISSTPSVRLDNAISLSGNQVWWVILNHNVQEQIGGNTYTRIRSKTWPIFINGNQCFFYCTVVPLSEPLSQSDRKVRGVSLTEIMLGEIDELLGIDPDDIISVSLSPFAPSGVIISSPQSPTGGTGTSADPMTWSNAVSISQTPSSAYAWFEASSETRSYTASFTGITATETDRYVLAGMQGEKLLDLPYGMYINGANLQLYNEPDGPYIEVTFRDGSLGNLEGCTVNVPLPTLPVNSNAWSSYVYSGKRDYDIEMRTITSNTNAWRNAGGGGAQGAMMGAFGPMGLALGVAGGTAGGMISYGVEMLYTNDEEQKQEDRLAANQPSSLILSSGSLQAAYRGYGLRLWKLTPDSYTLTQITNTRNNSGISVDEILASCETIVKTTLPTGYYSIKNLIISGNAPKEAKDYIKKKFDAGVRLL